MVSSTHWPYFNPGKDPVPIVQEAGWAPGPVWTAENLASQGFFVTTLYLVVIRVQVNHRVIIHGFRGEFLSVVFVRIWRCSRKDTLVRTGFPPSGALGLRSLEYTQISACVRAPSRPMMCFPTS